MAVNCPHCKLPLTEKEALAATCPVCANPLRDPAAAAPSPSAGKPQLARTGGGHGPYRIALAVALLVIAVLGGLLLAGWGRNETNPAENAQLREADKDAQPQHATPGPAGQPNLDGTAIEAKLTAAEKAVTLALKQLETLKQESAAHLQALEQEAITQLENLEHKTATHLQSLEQQVAAAKAQVQKLEQEKKDGLAQFQALQAALLAAKNAPPGLVPGKPIIPGIQGFPKSVFEKVFPAGGFKVIEVNQPNGEYRLPHLNNGKMVKLVGKAKKLWLEHIDNATLDATELVVSEVIVNNGVNNNAKIKINAPKGSVTIPYIDGKSQVEILCGDGKVKINWINNKSQVNVLARDFTLGNFLDGNDTNLTVILTAGGRLNFGEIRGKTHFLWKKALPTDPEIQVQSGIIRPPAEFRQLAAGG